ncbi:MAG: FlgD immunoglobulin-like domain containing protein, partial [Spirochaetota bacterium]
EDTATALDGQGANVTLNAADGGITAVQGTNTFAELASAGGSITLDTTAAADGDIGSATNRILFAGAQTGVSLATDGGSIWTGGLEDATGVTYDSIDTFDGAGTDAGALDIASNNTGADWTPTRLNGNIDTRFTAGGPGDGGNVAVGDPVVLIADVEIQTDGTGGGASDGDIQFDQDVTESGGDFDFTVDAGEDDGTITFGDGTDDGNGDSLGDLVDIGGTLTLIAASGTTGNSAPDTDLTLRVGDLVLDGGTGGTTVETNDTTNGTLSLYTPSGGTDMVLGDDSAGDLALNDTELANLAGAGLLVVGEDGTQAGRITFRTADLTAPGAPVRVYSNAAGGRIDLDDQDNTAAALDVGSEDVWLFAGGNDIRPVWASNDEPEIQTTGQVVLSSTSQIGDDDNLFPGEYHPVQFDYSAAGPSLVNIHGPSDSPAGDGAPDGAWLEGIGGQINVGVVNTEGGTLDIGVTDANDIRLTRDIITGGNGVTFRSPVILDPPGTTGDNTAVADAITIDTTDGDDGGGTDGSITFQDTLDAATAGGDSLILDTDTADILFSGVVGGTRVDTLQVDDARNVTFSDAVSAVSLLQTTGTGTTTFDGTVDTTDGTTGIDMNTDAIALGADLITDNGGTMTLDAPVTLTVDVRLDTTDGGATATGADITATSTVDSDAGNNWALIIDAGTDGTVHLDGVVGGSDALSYVRFDGAGALTSALPAGSELVDLSSQAVYVDADGSTITLEENVEVGTLIFYRGILDLGTDEVELETINDFVVFGEDYDPDDLDRENSGGADNAYFAYPNADTLSYYPAGGTYDDDTGDFSTAPNAKFADLAPNTTGSTITVGANFYVNGADMTGGAAWNLNLPATPRTSPIDGGGRFGSPYAVAFNMAVEHSNASETVTAAEPVGAEDNNSVTDNGNNTNWDFTRPEIVGAETVFDDVIRVTFSEPIENSADEISTALIGNTDLRVDGDTVEIIDTFVDDDGTPDAAPFNFTSTDGEGDLTTFYVRADTTWRTDATGTDPGDPDSTDPVGDSADAVPDLTALKGELVDAESFNLVRNYGRNGFPIYDGTTDEARPTLWLVEAGRAVHERDLDDASKEAYDGHNFFRLRYSEPVDIGGLTADAGDTAPENVRAQTTFAGAGEHGGHMVESTASAPPTGTTENPGVVDVVGYFNYPGSFLSGSRDNTTATNSLYRATEENPYEEHGLTIYVVGYSELVGGRRLWPGYMWGHSFGPRPGDAPGPSEENVGTPANYPFNVSDPVGETVTVFANANITDAAGNQIEPSNSAYDGVDGDGGRADKGRPTIDPVDTTWPDTTTSGWDREAPGFSTLSDLDDSREIVTTVNAENRINRVEFYFQDNFVSEDGDWDPEAEGSHVDDLDRHGIRDASFDYPDAEEDPAVAEHKGFFVNDIALDPVNGPSTDLVTSTFNFLFSDTSVPENVNRQDDPYLTLTVDPDHPDHFWTNLTDVHVAYDSGVESEDTSSAFVTDLAGNLLPSTRKNVAAVERVPPRIALSLIRVGTNKMYVSFTEPVFASQLRDTALDEVDPNSLFDFVDTDGNPLAIEIDSIEPITVTELPAPLASSVFDAFFYLTEDVDANFVIDARITANTDTVYDGVQNPMLDNILFPVSDIGLGIAEPVTAVDRIRSYGSFGEDFTTIRDFSGAGTGLVPGQIRLQARINADEHYGDPLRLYFDVDPSPDALVEDNPNTDYDESSLPFWLPTVVPGYNEVVNPAARVVLPFEANADRSLRTFQIPEDEEIQEGTEIEFLLRLGDTYAARLADPEDPRTLVPFLIPLRGIREQRSGVTILNNVINPTVGDKAFITYELPESGMVRVVVFTLNGDVVRVFHSGRQAAGSYTYAWDGTNERGRPVARGVYFIRVVGPDFDEYRKVMVVK